MAASVLLQSVPIAIRYVNCYVKHAGLTFFIKMTHGFNLGRYVWRKYYFKPGAHALCTTKSRQRQNTYSFVKSGRDLGFFSFYMEFCSAEFPVLFKNTWRCLNVHVKVIQNWALGSNLCISCFLWSYQVLLCLNKFGA